MTLNEIRAKYLKFFKDRDHAVIPSASLVPENDPSTLFTGSGMQAMVPYLLGEKHPEGTRIADSQKCFRAEDIDEVGDNRHTTFFEMLGNWSLGDYFKKKQIPWIFEFVTKELKLDPQKLYVTVFRGDEEFNIPRDDEAVKIWQEVFKKEGIDVRAVDFAEKKGLQGGRIFYYDATKNWWSRVGVPKNMPEGEPGGPDSEMFYDFDAEMKIHENSPFKDKLCHVNCDCGRFVEIGNSVFMSYVRKKSGFEELPNKNIDFGGGLERIAMAVNGTPDMFKIDVFQPVREILENTSGKKYGEDEKATTAFRIVMDHLRAATFLIADGVLPSNKDRGYFVRRIIRRSVFGTHQIGVTDLKWLADVVRVFADYYENEYPNLKAKKEHIIKEMTAESEKFYATLENGLKELHKEFKKMASVGTKSMHGDLGEIAFYFFETFGFPLDLFLEEVKTEMLHDPLQIRKSFDKAFEKHQKISRAGVEQKFRGGLADHSEEVTKMHTATHLLHAALRKVLGSHVEQKGSNITQERLRFDFSHSQKMTSEEIKAVEDLVNAAIKKDYLVSSQEMTVEEAKKAGAIGLFEERYGSKVKVYTIGDPSLKPKADPTYPTFSREICGGPHVEHTGVIGQFRILKEEAVSAGIRRVKAVVE